MVLGFRDHRIGSDAGTGSSNGEGRWQTGAGSVEGAVGPLLEMDDPWDARAAVRRDAGALESGRWGRGAVSPGGIRDDLLRCAGKERSHRLADLGRRSPVSALGRRKDFFLE